MTYVIGIDGGGTKTETVLCDSQGGILGYRLAGSSNHQIVGLDRAIETIRVSVQAVLEMANVGMEQIAHVYIGIAGADSEADKEMLLRSMSSFLDPLKTTVTNDCWIALSVASEERWGAISVCGTGNNACIRDQEGHEYALRGLQYEYGNLGGGNQLAKEALHHAFKADEGTGRATRLLTEIPKVLGFSDMDALCYAMYNEHFTDYFKSDVVRCVFLLANEGDQVCQDILIEMGSKCGDMLGRFIRRVGLSTSDTVPIVLSGSLYHKCESMLMMDALTLALRKHVPRFRLIVNNKPPVLGACYEALLQFGKEIEYTIVDKWEQQLVAFKAGVKR